MKLRIPNKYTGWLGPIEFVDGVSTEPVTVQQANMYRVSQSNVEILEDDGETVDEVLNTMAELLPREYYTEWNLPVPSKFLPCFMGGYPSAEEKAQEAQIVATAESDAKNKEGGYDRVELEAIADKQGIAGLRIIAETFKVKSTSIPKLIDLILEAQGSKAPATEETDQAV